MVKTNSSTCSLSLLRAYFQVCFANIRLVLQPMLLPGLALLYTQWLLLFRSGEETQAAIFLLRKCQVCLKWVSGG